MDAQTERGVAVLFAVDDHLVGIREHLRIAVGGGERQQHPLLRLHRAPVPVHVLLHEPRHRHRRVGAQQFLHGDRQELRLRPEPLSILGMSGQVPQRRSDGAPRRVDASQEQQRDRAADMAHLERDSVHLRVEEVRGEIVARVVDVVLHLVAEVLEQDHHPVRTLFHRKCDAFEHVLHESTEAIGVLLREAEHLHDHAHRDVLRVLLGGVDHIATLHRVDELLAIRASERFDLVDGLRRERLEQQPARALVEWWVGRDRRSDAGRRKLERRTELGHEDAARCEVVGVVCDCRDVFVPGRQPDTAVPLAVRDRARLSQLVPDRERVGGPDVVSVVEVGGPILDRRVIAHQSPPSRITARSGQLTAALRALSI